MLEKCNIFGRVFVISFRASHRLQADCYIFKIKYWKHQIIKKHFNLLLNEWSRKRCMSLREIQGHLWRLVIQYLLKIWSPRHLFGTDMQRRRRLWLPGQAWKRTGKQYRTSSTRTLTGHWTPKIHKINFWNYQYLRRWNLWYKNSAQ